MDKLFTVGKSYLVRSYYPTGLGRHDEAGRDANEGERVKILEVNEEENSLKLTNLNLGPNSWFWIKEEDFKKLIRFQKNQHNSYHFWLNQYQKDVKEFCARLSLDYQQALTDTLKSLEQGAEEYKGQNITDPVVVDSAEGLQNQIMAIKKILSSMNE